MRLVLRDPARVVGLTSHPVISRHPDNAAAAPGMPSANEVTLTSFQYLDYMRAFLNGRLAWSRLEFMLCSVGCFAIWRRDVVVELGGFSSEFTCEDIEFTFRVHEHFRRLRQPYRVIALSEAVGRTEGPDTFGRLVSQRARWQRVITETVWHYRKMMLNPRYGTVGLLGMPYYFIAEVLAPVFQAISVVILPLALWLGDVTLVEAVLFLLAVAFANGTLTNAALLLHGQGPRNSTMKALVRLILLGPLDVFYYRPFLFYAQVKGLIGFLRGDKAWHKFERNKPSDPSGAGKAGTSRLAV